MKVAIIGAGVSGLSCAHELERHGIKPTIYERKSFIGDIESHVTASIDIIDRPINNWIEYIKKKYDINITPINPINTLTHHSLNKTTVVKGNLGYLLKRNKEKDSLLAQLYSQLNNTKVMFNEYADYEKLLKAYDYVVIANGDSNYTNELGCWQQRVSGWIKGAVVLGNFNPTEIIMWINKDYTKGGYAYLTPFSEKKASISLFVPYVNEKVIDHYWELFHYTENIKYTIVEEFKVLHHSGNVYPHKVDNILFVGAAGGAVDPFLGFGQPGSTLQGIYAAQSIAKGKDYEELMMGIAKKNTEMWEFRKLYDKASNKDYDNILTAMGVPGIKQLIYKTPIYVFKYGAKIIRLKQKSKSSL